MALSVERAYNIDDWVEVENRSRPGGSLIGKVVEINWRATRLQTKADQIIVIPNSEWPGLSSSITAFPRGITGRKSRFSEPHHCPGKGQTHLDGRASEYSGDYAATGAGDNPSKVRPARGPVVSLVLGGRLCGKNPGHKNRHENVLKHLQVARIDLPYNRVDQRLVQPDDGKREEDAVKLELIGGVEFFKVMDENYLTRIANAMERKKYGAQEFIVNQDEAGDSLFIVEEGLVMSGSRMRKERISGWRIFNPAGFLAKWPY